MTPTSRSERCFYEPGAAHIVDVATPDGVSQCRGETLAQVRQRYPRAGLVPLADALTAIDAVQAERCKVGIPTEITEAQYQYALDVLPPQRWSTGPGWGFFYVPELVCGRIATWYVQLGSRYFELCYYTNTSTDTIVAACRTLLGTSPRPVSNPA